MDKTVRINLIWVIGLLLLAICAILLRIPDGKFVADYISFAASLASLILAVVAIFYSIISNQGFYQSISQLTGLAETIREGSSKLDSTSENFISRAEQLLEEVKRVPTSVETLGAKLEEKFVNALNIKENSERLPEDETGYRPFFGQATIGAGISLYSLALSFKTGKPLNVGEAFSSHGLQNYVAGFVTCLALSKFRGLDITNVGMTFEVKNAGELDVEGVIKRGEGRDDGLWVRARDELKAYFENQGASEVAQ